MIQPIQKAAVLGSGVMGSGIAAHLANIGIPTLLLDIVPTQLTPTEIAKGLTLQDSSVRNRFSELALQKMVKQKPAPLTTPKNLILIEPGNFEDDFPQLKEVDWIIEVVVEHLDVKRRVLKKLINIVKQGVLLVQIRQGYRLKQWQKDVRMIFKNIS